MMFQIVKLGVEKLFSTLHSVFKVNYGDENSVNISFLILSFMYFLNIFSILSLIMNLIKVILSIDILSIISGIIALVLCYFQFIYKSRYKWILQSSYFIEDKKTKKKRKYGMLLFVIATFILSSISPLLIKR